MQSCRFAAARVDTASTAAGKLLSVVAVSTGVSFATGVVAIWDAARAGSATTVTGAIRNILP